MSESRSRQLSALRRDLDRLAEEAQALEEEAVGAELLASQDLVDNVGIVWETAERLGEIYARQARYLLEDHLQTWRVVLDGSMPPSLSEVVGDHVERRVRHLTEGVEQSIRVMSHQAERTCTVLAQIWSPFLAVVREDWRRFAMGPRPGP